MDERDAPGGLLGASVLYGSERRERRAAGSWRLLRRREGGLVGLGRDGELVRLAALVAEPVCLAGLEMRLGKRLGARHSSIVAFGTGKRESPATPAVAILAVIRIGVFLSTLRDCP